MGLNFLAIVVAAIVMYVIGMLWYGPLFGTPWRKLMNVPEGKMQMPGTATLAGGFVATLIIASVLELFEVAIGVSTALGGAILAFWLWLGFVAPIMANSVFYERRPWTLYGINILHYLIALIAAAIVLALW